MRTDVLQHEPFSILFTQCFNANSVSATDIYGFIVLFIEHDTFFATVHDQ